jgi:hypothetical protein
MLPTENINISIIDDWPSAKLIISDGHGMVRTEKVLLNQAESSFQPVVDTIVSAAISRIVANNRKRMNTI